MNNKSQVQGIFWAAMLGLLGVALGAFGAHGLKRHLTEDMLIIFETGCRYQLIHALALLALCGCWTILSERDFQWITRFWVVGSIIFSGSLYVLAVSGLKRWGMVTPLGGVLLIAGWGWLCASSLKKLLH